MILDDLVEVVERFWRAAGDRSAYEQALAPDAVHVFAGLGVSDRGTVLQGVEQATPWESFEFADPRAVELGDAAALVYTARANRPGEDPYVAAVTSVYRRVGTAWELVLHQQTPLAG